MTHIVEHTGPRFWFVIWKRNNGGEVKDCTASFGISSSEEEALSRVQKAVMAGRTDRWSPEAFKKHFADGRFFPIPANNYIAVPGPAPEDRPNPRLY